MIRIALFIFLAAFYKDCPPSKVANVNQTTAIVNPSPTPETKTTAVSECVKQRVTNAPVGLTIPSELCLDDKKPIDQGEDKTVSEKLVGNTLSQENDIAFPKLPPEVQQIIRLTSGERYTAAKYNLSVILSDDPAQANRSVKSYIYTPVVFDANLKADTMATESWSFKRQDKRLKLESAELDAVK